MFYGLFADLVLVLHLAFVVFTIAGGLLNLRWPRAWMLHLPGLFWGFLVEFLAFACPLTTLENHLRAAAGQEGYAAGFIDHYISQILYPGLPAETHILLGFILAGLNIAVYAYLLRSKTLEFNWKFQ